MIRQIIKIDEEKCNGCGACANACHEGAIDMIDGKAKLVREHFCDGLGDCLPQCPTGAITFENREAPEYDEEAVKASQEKNSHGIKQSEMLKNGKNTESVVNKAFNHGGCPGSRSMVLNRENQSFAERNSREQNQNTHREYSRPVSELKQWPVQIKLVPTEGEFFDDSKLLVAADCCAYAYANMHEDFMKGKVTLIGCPKLDGVDYSEKLTEIISKNNIKSVTVVRMEVPCCANIQRAVETALKASGKFIPWQVVTISRNGKILD